MNEEVKYTQKDFDLQTAFVMTVCVVVDKFQEGNYSGVVIAICLSPLVYFFIRALSYLTKQATLGVDKSED